MREEKKGQFTLERQQRFLTFLGKLNWETETENVSQQAFDDFFNVMEKLLQSPDIENLVAPTMKVLADLWNNRSDLVEQSEIFETDGLMVINLSRLLKLGHY